MTRAACAAFVLLLATCRAPSPGEAARAGQPYLLVLGTAQDGGYPQIACQAELCRAAREDPSRRRFVVSLLLVDPRNGKRWLFEATPDLPEQIELARGHGGPASDAPGRPPLFDGIFLTHAHLGHYAGLAQLGREAYGSAPQTVYGTDPMCDYLTSNGPWSLLVDGDYVAPTAITPGERMALTEDLAVTAISVPHRAEFTDTVAYLIEGPSRSALFLPDIDKWERWEIPIEGLLSEVDLAFLDASFFDGSELPGRDMAEIPHPFVVESLERFAALPADERAKVRFIHLNHSNPLLDPASQAAGTVARAGFGVARQGQIHGL